MQVAHVYGNGVAIALDYTDGFFRLELGKGDGFPAFAFATSRPGMCEIPVLLITIPALYLAPIKAALERKTGQR